VKKEFGNPLILPPFKGRIHPEYDHSNFKQSITNCHNLLKDSSCEILLDSRNRIGVFNASLGNGKTTYVVIKEFYTYGINKLKSTFIPSKALKSWQGSNALLEREIKTPLPIAYLEKRKSIFLDQSFFLSEMEKDVEEIRGLFLKLPDEELREILKSLASFLSYCHKKGILHRDLSDGNILVRKSESNKFAFNLIDTNRIRVKKRIGLLQCIKNLVRLGVPDCYQRFFLENYLGVPHVKRVIWFWYKINKNSYTWFIEFKKALRLKQLARKIKIQ